MSLIKSLIVFRSSDRSVIPLTKIVIDREIQTSKTLTCSKSTQKQQPYSTRCKNFEDTPKFKAFKAKQAKMQCDDGYPVHLKGGLRDKILYHATVGGCVIGLIETFRYFYVLSKT